MRSSAALRSDIANLVRALDVPKAPPAPEHFVQCLTDHCRYAGGWDRSPCTMQRSLHELGRPCPLYRKEGE